MPALVAENLLRGPVSEVYVSGNAEALKYFRLVVQCQVR